MGHSSHSMNSSQPGPDACGHWAWLQSRLDRAAVLGASKRLDEWLGEQLEDLEFHYADFVTDSSRKMAAAALVKSSRR